MKRIILFFFLNAACAFAGSKEFQLSLLDAEQQAIENSWRLKAARADVETAREQEGAGYAGLFPRLSFQANYTYLSTLPQLSFAPNAPLTDFGSHNNYTLGPVLSYTLWDTFAALRTYESLTKLKESRENDRANSQIQLLYAVRSAYIRVQLAQEELQLVAGSLKLSHSQEKDVHNRFTAGAATKLDTIVSQRQVLNFKLQFQQKQAELSSALKDLLSLIGNPNEIDLSHPGPSNVDSVTLALKLDPLSQLLEDTKRIESAPPDDEQPQIKSRELLAQSADKAAASQTAKLFPTLQLTASTTLAYPNGPQLVNINQNTIGLALSIPLYLGDPNWHLAEQKRSEARSARYMARQLKTDIERDYTKAIEMLKSLQEQRKLAAEDVSQSTEVASLYYGSYKDGKSNLIDVQAANNNALGAKVIAARIDAQIANQLITLRALSGKDIAHD